MPDKAFEHTVRFYQVQTDAGANVWLPLITVALIQADGNRVSLPLLFDTGASVTTLRHDLYPLLGVPSWYVGVQQLTLTAGGESPVAAYRYQITLEVFGKAVQCPVHLQGTRQTLSRSPGLGTERVHKVPSIAWPFHDQYRRPSREVQPLGGISHVTRRFL